MKYELPKFCPCMQKLILVDCNSHAPVKQQVHNQDNLFQVPIVHGYSKPA